MNDSSVAETDRSDPVGFWYPTIPLARRHGPGGYADYESYRPFLRDDFTFRCVYCLLREQWGRVTGEFDLDHFLPQCHSPDQTADYENLLYACHACNLRKGFHDLPDPTIMFTSESVRVYPAGELQGLTDEAERLIRVLCLNSPRMIRWRQLWIRIIQLAEENDADLYRELMGYPEELPDLTRTRPPTNRLPNGVHQSYHARRQRGELPATYDF